MIIIMFQYNLSHWLLLFMQAFAELLEEENIKIPAWFSFNSKDGVNVVSGDSLVECASVAESCEKVAAVGINCTPPRFIHGLILSVKKVRCSSFVIPELVFYMFLTLFQEVENLKESFMLLLNSLNYVLLLMQSFDPCWKYK